MSQDAAPEADGSDTEPDFVEVDPSGRYGRYKEVLGKGAFKKVYKAFDEWEGIEVAWNQVKVADLLRNSVDMDRLYSEVHLLKTLKHKNIIKFYHSWVDTMNENINFITEIFTSGNLRQYRKKHKHVDVRALKKWSRQILDGLLYLHSHDPPVIHRDLKCDNLFVNGNQGEVKIGDLGLAAILERARAAHSVIGTPEFMAPELYEENYNELVDIYAFGMCLLELVTLEYPYVECSNAAQIYRKVSAGIKPASLEKVKDPEVRKFIEKCIAKVDDRLSAEELLLDPFLQSDEDSGSTSRSLQPQSSNPAGDNENRFDSENQPGNSVFEGSRDFMLQGQRKDHNTIFLKLRIADSSGKIRNIHFPFDIEVDTSIDVASEMVEELDLTDHDVSVIAATIDSEIQSHIPDWAPKELFSRNNLRGKAILEDVGSSGAASPTHTETNNPIVMERLPSGRKYWSDSPKDSGGSSPLRPGPSHLLLAESITSRDSWSEDNLQSPVSARDANSSYQGSPLRHVETDSDHEGCVKQEADDTVPLEEKTMPGESDSVQLEETAVPSEGDSDKIKDIVKELEHLTMPGESDSVQLEEKTVSSEGDSDDIKYIVEKLEHLMDEQQKELYELKQKHELAVLEFLKEIPQEIRPRVLSICNLNRHSKTKSLDHTLPS
ncbi:hypothetical protein ACS0TY_035734 [Phlomoides rotata]